MSGSLDLQLKSARRKELVRILRGGVGNATVWAVGWSTAKLAVQVASHWEYVVSGAPIWGSFILDAANQGAVGFFAGAIFSVYLRAAHRNRSLSSIRVGVSASIGALLALGLFPLLDLLPGPWLGGGGVGGWIAATLLGGVSAGCTVLLARRVSTSDLPEAAIQRSIA